jgi:hypothetical protein
MKTYRIYFSVFAVIFLSGFAWGQIGGVSASKLATISTDVVPYNVIEFEPSVSADFSKGYWNSGARFISFNSADDSLVTNSDLYFRFTYGAIKNLEVGFTVPSNVSRISVGVKYLLPFSFDNNTTFGIMAGLNAPLGNSGYSLTLSKKHQEYSLGLAAGGIISHAFTDVISCDVNIQAQKHFPSGTVFDYNTSDFSFGTDFGYYFVDGIQAVLGINYYSSSFNDSELNQYSLIFNPGFTFEKGKNFIIVLNMPVMLKGKNVDDSIGFGFALTTAIH